MAAAEALDSTQPPEALEQTADTGFMSLGVHGGGAHHSTGIVPAGFEGIDSHVLDAAPRARLSDEERLEREVTRRRQAEAERRARIFNAKRRTIGVDKDFLDQQVTDVAARKKAQAEATRAEDRQFMGVNRMLQLKEKEKTAGRFEAEKAAKEYGLQYLSFQSRDVFDLNDPKAVTKATPARLGDTDPRCGPASMQQFNGEDLLKDERDRQQKLATVNALEQQIFEKNMLAQLNADDGAEFQQQAQDVIDLRNEVEAEEAALRKDIMDTYQEDLKAKMYANCQAKSDESEQNQQLNQQELDFHASDPFLQETRPHVMTNGRALPSLYKGSTRDERVQVFGEQLQQCHENAGKRAQEGAFDRDHHSNVEMTRRQLVMMEREKQRMRRAMQTDVASHNQGMVKAQKDALSQAGPDGHKNKFDQGFFTQFGVGTR